MKTSKLIFSILLLSSFYMCHAQGRVQSEVALLKKDNDSVKGFFSKNIGDEWRKVTSVSIYGGGNLLGQVTSEDPIENSAVPSGSLGLNFWTSLISCDLYFSYNAKSEVDISTLAKFGSAIMNPNLGGQGLTFNTRAKFNEFVGFTGNMMVADNTWKLSDETSVDASPLILRLGAYFTPFDFRLNENTVNLSFDVYYTHRSILGDFNNGDQVIKGNIISPRGYNGFDVQIQAIVNALKFYVQFSANSKQDLTIPGFSGSQVLFGLAVTGDAIKLK